MFTVTCKSKIDSEWQERDQELYKIAGRSHTSGAECSINGEKIREHLWDVLSLNDGVCLRKKLLKIKGVISVVICEKYTPPKRRGKK